MSATAMLWIAGALIACAAIALAAWALFADRARGRRRCPKCWYDMSGAAAPREGDAAAAALRRPECGREIKHARQLARTRRRWRWTFVAALLLLVATGCFITGKAKRDGWETVTPTTVLILIAQWSDDPWALQKLWERSSAPYLDFIRVFQDRVLWDWQWRWLLNTCLDRVHARHSPLVREAAMEFLYGSDLTWDAAIHQRAIEVWPSLLDDSDQVIQRQAIVASAGFMPIDRAIEIATDAAHRSKEHASSAMGAIFLIDRRGGEVRASLLGLLNDGSVEQRRMAAAMLGRLKSTDPYPDRTLEALLNHVRHDADAGVRGQCLKSLARTEAPRDVLETLLAQAIADRDPTIRTFALDAEMYAADKSLLKPEHVFQCLQDENQEVRDNAFFALMEIDSERLRDHVPELQRLLDHADEGIAQAAAQKLEALGVAPAAGKPAR